MLAWVRSSNSLTIDWLRNAVGWKLRRLPLLPLFPEHGNDAAVAGLSGTTKGGVAEMGVGEQFACASLVAAFSLALFITANLFVESRAAKNVVLTPASLQVRMIPL
jgi:hypothetical protein